MIAEVLAEHRPADAMLGEEYRDGLMTGLVQRTGASVTVVRSCIEIVVIAVGWLLGGMFFIGSVLYAFGIGPVTQLFLRLAARLLGPADPMASENT